MPRKAKEKIRPKKGQFSRETMHDAILKVRAGMKIRAAAKTCGLNYQTLSRYVKYTNNLDQVGDVRLTPNYSVRRVFSLEQEKLLVEYVLDRSMLGFGMTAIEIRKLAFSMAKANDIPFPKQWEVNEMSDKDWFQNFMKRHQELSPRKPEQCSIARTMAFNKINIQNYSEKLESVLQRNPFFADGSRIFNLDETSTTTVGKVNNKIISPRGIKQVHQVKSAERGINVTTCSIIGAHGQVIPPAMIFPRMKFNVDMIIGAFPGTLGLASKKGWMTGDLFVQVLKHFIKCTGSTVENPTLLIVDNVESHLTIQSLDLCKKKWSDTFHPTPTHNP